MAADRTQQNFDPEPSESESNRSARRARWAAANLDGDARAMVDADARAFLHQSVSTPCLSAIRRAEGIWIEDLQGRRTMDFHGNNVHHIGYGHPRLIAAIKAQLDALPFSPRRYTNQVAIELAEKLGGIAPGDLSPNGLSKVLFTTGGSDAIEVALKLARAQRTPHGGRFKTVSFWDAFHGAGFGASSVGGEQLFHSGAIGPLLAGLVFCPPAEHRELMSGLAIPFSMWQCAGHGDAAGPGFVR